MAFINCLIVSADNARQRIEIRNELIGLKLLEVIAALKREANSDDLSVECDVFDDHQQRQKRLPGDDFRPDLNTCSLQDMIDSIVQRIADKPDCETAFRRLLQHLIGIEYSDCELSALVWTAAETLVYRATTLIGCREDADKLLAVHQNDSCVAFTTVAKQLNGPNESKLQNETLTVTPPPPPPPPPPPQPPKFTPLVSNKSLPPKLIQVPPQPPSLASQPTDSSMRHTFQASLTPPPPPPPPPPFPSATHAIRSSPSVTASLLMPPSLQFSGGVKTTTDSPPAEPQSVNYRSHQTEIPRPKSKMKSLNWCKITPQKVHASNRPNVWSIVATQLARDGVSVAVDFTELEGLFCQAANSSAPNSCPGSPRLPRRPVSSDLSSSSPYNSLERKVVKRQSGEYQPPPLELTLLDSKKSLNVNIFLKQFRGSSDEIIGLILDGRYKEIGAERLKNLLKILPEGNEIELFRNFNGDLSRMPAAEKFLYNLIKIPDYKIKIEGMLLKEEYESIVAYLVPAIQAVTNAANELKQSKALQEILYLILVAGNFLNSGGYAGDAVGFKMMALLKLPEIRANKPGINLIHYVAMQAEKKGLNDLSAEIPSLEEASKVSIEALRTEVSALAIKICKIKNELSVCDANSNGHSFHRDMTKFLMSAEEEANKLALTIESRLNAVRLEVADYLCEDAEQFKLEECFRIFASFGQRLRLAVDENERRKENELKMEARKSNSQLKRWSTQSSNSPDGVESMLTDSQPTAATPVTTTQNQSQSVCTNVNGLRRRSRRNSQDDELHNGLIEFLKTANDLGSNEQSVFGGTFRRMGSGRKSRSSNHVTNGDLAGLSSRERNVSEESNNLRNKEMNGESNDCGSPVRVGRRVSGDGGGQYVAPVITNNINNSSRKSYNNYNNNNLLDNSDVIIDAEYDSYSRSSNNFNRFSPLRKTFSVKTNELESRLAKRYNDLEANMSTISPLTATDSDSNNNINGDSGAVEMRKFWGSKDNNNNNTTESAITRPSTLHLNHHTGQQPTAIITPTKLHDTTLLDDSMCAIIPLTPALTIESPTVDSTGKTSRLPRRTSIVSPTTVITAAAIVAPLPQQPLISSVATVHRTQSMRVLSSRSKLPVRKNSLTRLPKQRKTGAQMTTACANNIPISARPVATPTTRMVSTAGHRPVGLRRSVEMTPNARTYRSPSTVSRTNLTSDSGSVASMRRASQMMATVAPPANRSFMKQTSSSAAKSKLQSKC